MANAEDIHPGRIVRTKCIEPAGLSVTQAAQVLGVTRQALNNLLNGKAGLSPEMALRLEKAFGDSSEMWLGLQLQYDLAQARKHEDAINVRPWVAPAPQDQLRLL